MPSLVSVHGQLESHDLSAICQTAVETGRNNAFNLWVMGAPLEKVLNALVSAIETASEDLRCSIMLMNPDGKTMSSLVGPSMPKDYMQAVDGIEIGPTVGSCGASAYLRQAVVVSDIQTHPNWAPYKAICQKAGLRACWSSPIFATDGRVLGAFGMYYSAVREPTNQDLELIRIEASIASLIIEKMQASEQLSQAKRDLEQQVQKRTRELTQTNKKLREALAQRSEVQQHLLEIENLASLGSMMSSLTHEVNTPIGVAVTAASHLRGQLHKTNRLFEQNKLTRSALRAFYEESAEAMQIIERNLQRSAELVSTFKQLSLDQHNQEIRTFNLSSYVCEILLSLKPKLKYHKLQFCLDINPDLEIDSYPGAISQILVNLIMNSVQHAFEKGQPGQVHLNVTLLNGQLELKYQDNGKGMSRETLCHIFEPFFTSARQTGGSGLGLHICKDLVEKVLKGKIACQSSPGQGSQFHINFPV
ncbi:ATP-binding protein [Bowmanella yangjiangensis]|uniref:histidine kinase n=1 Tax=Bowmanella yangjiangensis TaxID=2811230 RepID=A0ABS3CQ82_9ALTE|nr:GAF domain-containing sensor histidine kinase [Bowmanella yangjiangensis]MBN7818326.1 GAF domain-containing sensor histidine kinase [Bowmanella yangjiangensis]